MHGGKGTTTVARSAGAEPSLVVGLCGRAHCGCRHPPWLRAWGAGCHGGWVARQGWVHATSDRAGDNFIVACPYLLRQVVSDINYPEQYVLAVMEKTGGMPLYTEKVGCCPGEVWCGAWVTLHVPQSCTHTHMHVHARTHKHTHTNTRTRTHTHTHIPRTIQRSPSSCAKSRGWQTRGASLQPT